MLKDALIAYDMDGVLMDCASAIVEFSNDRYGTRLRPENIVHYELCRMWKCSKQEEIRRINEFFDSPHFSRMGPYTKIEKILDAYGRGNRQVVLTSRPLRTEKKTQSQISYHFPRRFSGIHHAKDKPYDNDRNRYASKAEACTDLGVAALFEDCIEIAIDVAEKTDTEVFLVDRSWNRYLPDSCSKLPGSIVRVVA